MRLIRLLPVRADLILPATLFVMCVAAPGPAGIVHAQTAPVTLAQMEQEQIVVRTAQGEFPFNVEIADDGAERSRGLMFREVMAPDHGMLFVFGETRVVQMWMKNTPMSLDMVFLRPDGSVATIAERTEPYSETIIDSGEPVSHVLELKAGVARMIGLKPGDRLEHATFKP